MNRHILIFFLTTLTYLNIGRDARCFVIENSGEDLAKAHNTYTVVATVLDSKRIYKGEKIDSPMEYEILTCKLVERIGEKELKGGGFVMPNGFHHVLFGFDFAHEDTKMFYVVRISGGYGSSNREKLQKNSNYIFIVKRTLEGFYTSTNRTHKFVPATDAAVEKFRKIIQTEIKVLKTKGCHDPSSHPHSCTLPPGVQPAYKP